MRTTFHGSRLGPDLLLIAHRLFVLAFIYLFISWLPDHFVPCLLQVELYYHHIVSPPEVRRYCLSKKSTRKMLSDQIYLCITSGSVGGIYRTTHPLTLGGVAVESGFCITLFSLSQYVPVTATEISTIWSFNSRH